MTRLQQKWESKNINVRRYPNGYMGCSVEDAAVLKQLTQWSTFTASEYDPTLSLLSQSGFSITVIN